MAGLQQLSKFIQIRRGKYAAKKFYLIHRYQLMINQLELKQTDIR